MSESEVEQLTALCVRLGASPTQASAMALQLLKRAEQLALERGLDRTVALGQLIDLVIRGRKGEGPPSFQPNTPPAE